MGKALKLLLAMSAVSVAMLANAAEPGRVVGCTKTAKACTCYSPSGRPVEVAPDLCEAKFLPLTVMTFAGGDISPLLTVPKPVHFPEPEPYRGQPVPWLIEH